MKITVAGAGAMGCRFGAALFEAGHHVTLLDGWREHVTAINEAGRGSPTRPARERWRCPLFSFPLASQPTASPARPTW